MGPVALVEVVLLAHVGIHHAGVGAAEEPLVEALQRELARAAPRRLGAGAPARRAWAGVEAVASASARSRSSSRRWAISTATRAASRPLSATRAQAWASFSNVRTALAMAPWSSPTRVTAAPLSLATSSK